MRLLLLLLSGGLLHNLPAQSYQSYVTGDTSDVTTPTSGGIVLMGGATENDNAMRWFLQQSGGGDILILRASGSDGYNDYLYSELGVPVNSVQTIVTPTVTSANLPYVINKIRQAEGLWIAGGDQSNYVNFWRNTAVEAAIRYLIEVKKAPIGGTSAGMAIQGDAYFAAMNGSITSTEALQNPYDTKMTIGYHDFLNHPRLAGVITDTHYDNPDRRGRHVAFMARLVKDFGIRAYGIACEEYTAVCIDSAGIGHIFGKYPTREDYVYFMQTTCEDDFMPELCSTGLPLHWERNQAALKVVKIPARNDGSTTFDLNDWKTSLGEGAAWGNWWVSANGILQTTPSVAPDCTTAVPVLAPELPVTIQMLNASRQLHIQIAPDLLPAVATLYDFSGRTLTTWTIREADTLLAMDPALRGAHALRLTTTKGVITKSFMVGE